MTQEVVQRRAERERRARLEAETLLEKKSLDLYRANQYLRQLADSLAAKEEKSRSILSAVSDGVLTVDEQEFVCSFNPAAERIFGYQANEVIGLPLRLLLKRVERAASPADASGPGNSARTSALPAATTHNLEMRGRRKDGEMLPVEIGFDEVFWGQSRVRIVTVRDISERKRAEQALRKAHDELERRVIERTAELQAANVRLRLEVAERRLAEEGLRVTGLRLSALIANLHAGILVVDEHGQILLSNDVFCRLFELPDTPEELVGSNCEAMLRRTAHLFVDPSWALPHPSRPRPDRHVAAGEEVQLRNGKTYERDHVPIYIEDAYYGDLWLYRDITGRRMMTEELQRAKETAEATTRAKSEFLANMSHEIRTPMNAILGMTALLLDTSLDKTQLDYVSTVHSSSEALLTIINDILDFSRIESGKLELEQQPFEVRACLEGAFDVVSHKAAEKGLELACLIGAEVPARVLGDAIRLRQILINLLGNAVKFTTTGGVVVTVHARTLAGGASELRFAVRDTGIGIPREQHGRLFQMFSQVDASTTRRFGGTGLGLAISKRLCELMGGTIWFESAEGQGTTFHFTLVANVAASPGSDARETFPAFSGKRLLLVDDSDTTRRALVDQLREWGFAVHATGSPDEAYAWIRQGEAFDLALLDQSLPSTNGLDLADQIRAQRGGATLPLILLANAAPRESLEPDDRFITVLPKPVKPSSLYNLLLAQFSAQAPIDTNIQRNTDVDKNLATQMPLRILLAEDNQINQKVARAMLNSLGYQCDIVGDGSQALTALQRQSYDVVLMDMQMPEMDGLEVTRRICRQWPKTERPHIIALTANAMVGDREACLAAGMDDYISKPMKLTDLERALRDASRAIQQASAAKAPAHSFLGDFSEEEAAEILEELFGLYLTDTPKHLSGLREAIQSADFAKLTAAAHSLKGSSAYITGAETISSLSAELEQLGRAKSLDGAENLLQTIEAEFGRIAAHS